MAGHDRRTPEGRHFFKQIEELKKLQVRVGYQQGKTKSDEGVDMVDIAMWNELGTARSPARPFIRNSADMNKNMIEKICAEQLQKIGHGGTAEQALNAIGSIQKGLIQDTISKSKSWAKPNADRTVEEKKGSDQPLVDTGRLMQSVDYVIVPKGGGE
jgi:hypothetical protein